MHEQLIQLLEKHFGSVDTVPPQLRALLDSIDESYQSRDQAEAEREEAQKNLEDQRAFLRQVIDTNPDSVFAKDRQGRYTLANQAMAEFLKTNVDDILGKIDRDFYDQETTDIFLKEDRKVLSTGNDIHNPGKFKADRDGKLRWLETIKRPLYNKDNQIEQVLGVVSDITEHKKAEKDLKLRNMVLEIVNQISRDISLTLELPEILNTVSKRIATTLDVTSVYINDWKPETGISTVLSEHISKVAAEWEADPSVGNRYRLNEDFQETAKWLENPSSHLLRHVDDPGIPPKERKYLEDNHIKTSLCMAIYHEGTPFGYLEIYESREKKEFSQMDIDFLETISFQLATAINNARFHQALQESENRFRALLANSSAVITILDQKGIIEYTSSSIERVLGIQENSLVGQDVNDLIHPEDLKNAQKSFSSTLQFPGQYINFEFRIQNSQTEWCILESTAMNVPQDGGGNRIYITSRDITEKKVTEKEQQELYERRGKQVRIASDIAREIAASPDMGELYRRVVNTISNKLGFYHVQLFRYSPAADVLALVSGSGNIGSSMLNSGYQIPMHSGPVGTAAVRQASVLIPDTKQEPGWVAQPNLEKTISEIATPVLLGDELLGILDIHSDQQDSVQVDTQLVLEVLSGQIAVAIESIRLRTEMEERIRELNALQQLTTTEGWQSFFETEAKKAQAYTFDQSAGEAVRIGKDDIVPYRDDRERLINTMQIRGEVIGAIGVQDDPDHPLSQEEQNLLSSITEEVAEALERARLFESSQRSAAELAILNEMANAFTESLNEDAIIENIYIYTSRLMQVEDFYIALYHPDEEMITFPLATQLGVRVTEGHDHWDAWQPRKIGEGLTGHIIKTVQPLLIEENAEQILEEAGLPFKRHGDLTQSWAGVPMALGDRVLGVIAAQSDLVPGLYNQHHLDLLFAVSSQAAIAIDNARLFQQEQERAQQERLVRTITDRVRRGGNSEDILRIAMEELSQALGAVRSVARLGTKEQLLSDNSKKVSENASAKNGKPQADEK